MCFPISITCPLETFVPRGRYDVLLLRRTGGTRVPFYKSHFRKNVTVSIKIFTNLLHASVWTQEIVSGGVQKHRF